MCSPTSSRQARRSNASASGTAWEWVDECAVRMPLAAHHADGEDLKSFIVELACRLTEAVITDGVESEPVDVDADGHQGPWSDVVVRLLRVAPTLALVRVELTNLDKRAAWLITLRRRPLPTRPAAPRRSDDGDHAEGHRSQRLEVAEEPAGPPRRWATGHVEVHGAAGAGKHAASE